MIAIKDFKMPENCLECPMQFGGWCYVSPPEVDERVAPTVDEAWEQGKPDWCPLIDVPDNNVGKISELPNSDDVFVTVEEAIDLIEKACDTWEFEYATSDEDWWSEVHKARDMAVEALKQPEIIRCKECVYSHMTYGGDCKNCDKWEEKYDSGESLYLKGDFFCGFGERKTDETD